MLSAVKLVAGVSGVRRVLSGKGAGVCVHRATQVAFRAQSTTPFLLADIGEGIAEVELMQWFVKEGDTIKSFDRICEVQSDKATVEITSRYDGVVEKIHYQEGEIAAVGTALLDILTADGVNAPKKMGSDPTPKLTVPPSVETPQVAPPTPSVSSVTSAPTSTVDLSGNDKVKATPAVRKIAKENGIDLRLVAASGPAGRILKEDVLTYIQGGARVARSPFSANNSASSPADNTATPATYTSSYSAPVVLQEDKVVPIRGVARLMVKTMQASQQVQHLTLMEEVRMDAMVNVRSGLKKVAESRGVKLSYMPFIIKAASMALEQFPELNATVNADVTEVIHHASHNIGVAMDTPNGLVVPVIKGIQNMSIFDVGAALMVLQEKAMSGKLGEADLKGGTFTLSNIGSIGGTYATPVLVVPQVAIGALGRLQVVPRYVGKNGSPATPADVASGEAQAMPATVMNMSWSADHRVVDGATVARFSNAWKAFIEDPNVMLGMMR